MAWRFNQGKCQPAPAAKAQEPVQEPQEPAKDEVVCAVGIRSRAAVGIFLAGIVLWFMRDREAAFYWVSGGWCALWTHWLNSKE